MTNDDPVQTRQHGGLGRITLNRPQEINALSHAMVATMRLALRRWREDTTIRTVVIDGAGEHGLCAGEDLTAVFDDARFRHREALESWAEQYRLSAEMRRYPHPRTLDVAPGGHPRKYSARPAPRRRGVTGPGVP